MASTFTDNDKARLAIKALNEARKARDEQFDREHPGMFREMVEQNRLRLGLSRRPQGDSPEQTEEKLRKAEERAAKLRKELQAYGR